jgi:hypothetical protein
MISALAPGGNMISAPWLLASAPLTLPQTQDLLPATAGRPTEWDCPCTTDPLSVIRGTELHSLVTKFLTRWDRS